MVPENQISDFVSRLRQAAKDNLESVIVYGSAASGEFHPEHSNINLLCILRETSYAALVQIAPVVAWWDKQNHPAPLVLTREELERSTDVFSIELLDMRERHKTVFGENVLHSLDVPLRWHRIQLEYELREKLILLRERLLLAAGNKARMWELLQASLPGFATLFRHALIALGEKAPTNKREVLDQLAAKLHFDPSVFVQLFDLRRQKVDVKQLPIEDLCARYLAAVEHVTAAVDKMLDSGEPAGS